jgi:tetratricopeptide (TPR) repeat protein
MRFTLRHINLPTVALILLCAPFAEAQFRPVPPVNANTAGDAAIRGRVLLPGGGFLSEGVRISLQTIRGTDSTVYTDSTGAFQFTRLTPGRYQVVVEADQRRFEILTESVELTRGTVALLNISLKERKEDGKLRAGIISVAEMDSNVPSKARSEFERASALTREGKVDEAIDHLRKAVALYPHYLAAHNDLGALLLDLNRLDQAEEELRTALAIDQTAFNPILNLGIVLTKKAEWQRAKETLQKGISLQPRSAAARLYLGLASEGTSDFDQAQKEFAAAYEIGGSEFAIALFHLGQLYLRRGDRDLARETFERYLKEAPKAPNLDQVRRLIATLE